MTAVIKKLAIVGIILVIFQATVSADANIKPFILAYSGAGDMNTKITDTREKLTTAGFDVIAEYSPYDNVNILIFSNGDLKSAATKSKRGGYGAVMRAAITEVNDVIEVAYTNPVYWANAYRMATNLENVSATLKKAFGASKQFGTGDKKLSKKDMRDYHYTFMMEYFDDPSELATFSSHADAVKMVEEKLTAGVANSKKIYRIDLGKDTEGQRMTLFGISLKGKNKDDCSADEYIMSRIDRSQPRHSAHLPYELLVYGSTAEALYARFRIAISWPHLPMMTSETGATFMSIMCAPGAIEDALKLVAGFKPEVEEEDY